MEVSSPKESSSVASSPYSSPNVGALLKIKILSWSHETGFPLSVRVRVSNRTFNIHKFPLFSKSGYFKRRIGKEDSPEIELPPEFPGGSDTFEMILLFVYGSTTLIDPFNVATLRCAAEFLEMTEDNCPNNLCDRFDLYMNQVVLQNWDDTLIVLQKCQALLPVAEELLIVSRCIESLAFMACMEILDPERRRDHPVVTSEALSCSDRRPWSSDQVKEILRQELWIKDLISLPFNFFKRIIGSLRRQGMREKYVSPIIVLYANKWLLLLSNKTDDKVLQGILDLLTLGDKASKSIPVGFYFALLSKSLEVGLRSDKLLDQIVSMLHLADLRDLMSWRMDLSTMERIVSMYVASSDTEDASHVACALSNNAAVGELWDGYLCNVAMDTEMEPDRFVKLIEIVPMSYRHSHDNLYKAVNAFLEVHRDVTQEEKGGICKYLSCQKLSQEICVEAVQNDLMPLRLIVQALFVQQMNTQQAFKECSDSFRYTAHCSGGGDFSGSLSSSRCPFSSKSPYTDDPDLGTKPLGFLLQKDHQNHVLPNKSVEQVAENEYESTSFRIQSLEHELMSLKRSLRWQKTTAVAEVGLVKDKDRGGNLECVDHRSMSKRRNNLGELSGCIGFSSRRKYVSRIMKVFRRITLTGGGRKLKRKPGTPSSWPI